MPNNSISEIKEIAILKSKNDSTIGFFCEVKIRKFNTFKVVNGKFEIIE